MQETEKNTTTDAAHDRLWRAAKRAVERLRRGRPDERGITTLEWLLIVAAVAGLAALAVVLVQNVVDDTAEQIGGNSARGTAARVAAERVTREARSELPEGDHMSTIEDKLEEVTAWVKRQRDVNEEYGAACDRLEITYGDISANFDSTWTPAVPAGLWNGNDATFPSDSFTSQNRGTISTHDSRPDKNSLPITGSDRKEAKCTVTLGTD